MSSSLSGMYKVASDEPAVMSVHFPHTRLYEVIKDNDVKGLEEAIFFLSAKIHEVSVWRGKTAVFYAASLGHLEQVKILLDDFDRYCNMKIEHREMVILLSEVVAHRESDPDLFLPVWNRLVFAFENVEPEVGYFSSLNFIDSILRRNAFSLLETLVERRPDKYIPFMMESSFQCAKREVFQMSESVQQHPVFLRELEKKRVEEPLKLAIIRGDTEEVDRLLANNPTAELFVSNTHCVIPFLELDSLCSDCPTFLNLSVKLDDVNLFQKMLTYSKIKHHHRLIDMELYPQYLLRHSMDVALQEESLAVILFILNHDQFDKTVMDWPVVYYELLIIERQKSAAAIKHLVNEPIDQSKRDELFKELVASRSIRRLRFDAPVQTVLDIVEAIDSLPENRPALDTEWRRAVIDWPREKNRPDLVKSFQRYGVGYSELDVLDKMARIDAIHASKRWQYSYMRERHEWDTACNSMSIPFCEFVFLCGYSRIVMDQSELRNLACDRSRLEFFTQCVAETGSIVDVMDDADMDTHIILQTIESARQASMSLQKLSRLAVREAVRVANPGNSLTDAISTLYVNGQLPKILVNYLLYRDEDKKQPLHYRLVGVFDPEVALSSDEDEERDSSNDSDSVSSNDSDAASLSSWFLPDSDHLYINNSGSDDT